MTPAQLSRTVLCAVRRAVQDGELSPPVPGRVVVERPRRPGCGDYATTVALQLAKVSGRPPRRVAEILGPRLAAEPGIARVEIAGPGFLNITLDPASHTALVRTVLARGAAYGSGDALAGQAVELRFPGEVRAAVTADALGRILRAQGADTVLRCTDRPDPDWAALRVGEPDGRAAAAGPAAKSGGEEAGDQEGVSAGARGPDPGALGSASPDPASPGSAAPDPTSLGSASPDPAGPGSVRPAADRGAAAPSGSAPSAAGRAGRTVLVRPVPLRAAAGAAAPDGPGPEAVPASSGAACLLRRLGPDAARWALLRPAAHDRPRTGDDLLALLVQRETNPLFRVRYAHARCRALVRNAADLGFTPLPGDLDDLDDSGRPVGPDAAAPGEPSGERPAPGESSAAAAPLLAALGDYPAVVAAAARYRAPDRVARHLEATADAFLRFHAAGRPLPCGEEKPRAAHRARTALAQAAGTVLAGGLHLLGIGAPDFL